MTFVRELADALHADGRTLTVSIPPVYDPAVAGGSGYWVYDARRRSPSTSTRSGSWRYDYSVAEPGPIAPLAWVQQAVDGVSKAVPEEYHDKLVLGVPAYGANWVTATTGTCPADAEGKTTVNTRNVLDLVRQARRRRRSTTRRPASGRSRTTSRSATRRTSCVQSREVHWVDSEGAAARAEIARRAGWGGVALWALGYDDDETWQALLNATRDPMS